MVYLRTEGFIHYPVNRHPIRTTAPLPWRPPCRPPLRPQQVRDPVVARPRFAPGRALRPIIGVEGSLILR